MIDWFMAVLWGTYLFTLFFSVFWLINFFVTDRTNSKMTLKDYPKVSIVLPAYNEEESIARSIKSVLELDYPKDKLQVIIVNDGSSDNTSSIAKSFPVQVIDMKNGGKGAALNRGLGIADGEFFVCLDADSFVEKEALKVLLPYFHSLEVGAVLPALRVEKKGANLLQKMQHYEYIINMFYKELMGKLDCIRVTPGPFSVYRTSVLRKLGGFDAERNLTEDLEMALRLQSNHYKIVQVMDTCVSTIAPSTFKGVYRQRNRWYKGSIINNLRYKNLFFNRKYGDFGMMEMPTSMLSGVIVLLILSSIFYYTLIPAFNYLYYLSFVNFDILTFLKNWSFNFVLLDLDFSLILLSIVMLGVSVFVLSKSHVANREKVWQFGFIPVILYMLFYFLILGVVWGGIALDLLFSRKQKW